MQKCQTRTRKQEILKSDWKIIKFSMNYYLTLQIIYVFNVAI